MGKEDYGLDSCEDLVEGSYGMRRIFSVDIDSEKVSSSR